MRKTPRTLFNLLRAMRVLERRNQDINLHLLVYDLCNNYPNVFILGTGGYSIALEIEGRVFKIVKKCDNAYSAFVEFCIDYGPNRYLPRFDNILTIRGFTVYEIERLDPCYDMDELARAIWAATDFHHWGDLERFPELCEVATALADRKPHFAFWDFHYGNFAYRGNQLVILDPWA